MRFTYGTPYTIPKIEFNLILHIWVCLLEVFYIRFRGDVRRYSEYMLTGRMRDASHPTHHYLRGSIVGMIYFLVWMHERYVNEHVKKMTLHVISICNCHQKTSKCTLLLKHAHSFIVMTVEWSILDSCSPCWTNRYCVVYGLWNDLSWLYKCIYRLINIVPLYYTEIKSVITIHHQYGIGECLAVQITKWIIILIIDGVIDDSCLSLFA